MIYRLTIYEADDTATWLQVSTDPDATNPWLVVPDSWVQSEVDFISGSSSIGEIVVEVLDPQTGSTQAVRGLTAKLADTNGRSAMSGRRAKVEDSENGATFRTVFDGVINRVELLDSLSSFAISIRDIRERERNMELFRFTNTCSVLPQGVLDGYGEPYPGAPTDDWLIPPTRPLVGTFRLFNPEFQALTSGYVDLSEYVLGTAPDGVPLVDPQIVLSGAAQAALQPDGGTLQVRALWRPEGSSGAFSVVNYGQFTLGAAEIFAARVPVYLWLGREDGEEIVAARTVVFPDGFGLTNPLPDPGDRVEVIVQYIGETSEDWPLHIEGRTAGQVLKDVYDGVYSESTARVRYDETSVLALNTPVRLRITESVTDAREWVESNLYVAAGAAPAIVEGEIYPVTYELPDITVDVTELGNAEADAVPGWAQATDDAVNVVEVIYPRDRSVDTNAPGFDRVPGDRIISREVKQVRVVPESVSLLGERRKTIQIDSLRAIGGAMGGAYSGNVADETGAQVAARIATMLGDRFALGGQVFVVVVDRTVPDVEDLIVGDWVVVNTTWTPDYQTGTRAGNRLGQIIARRDMSPIRCELVVIDGGPDAQPFIAPTLGTISQTALQEVVVPIASAPTGAVARVDYAISTTQPAASSKLWTFADRAPAGQSVTTPRLPTGKKVWIRARSEGVARRPSGYTTPVAVDITAVAGLRRIFGYVSGSGVEIYWFPVGNTAGVRIEYIEHPFGDEPDWDYAQTVDTDTSPELLVGPFDRVANQVLSFRVTPYPGFSGGSVTGSPGPAMESSVLLGAPENVPFGYVVASLDGLFVDFFTQGNQLAESGAWAIRIGQPPTAPNDPNAAHTGTFDGSFANVRRLITEPGTDPVWVGVWFYTEESQGGEIGPRVLARVATDLEPLLFNFREVARTDTTVTYGWSRNAATKEIWVYKNTVSVPQVGDPWPTVNDLPDEVLTTANTYTVTIPAEGFGTFVQFEPRTANLQPGSVWRLVINSEGVSAGVSLAKTTEEEDRIAGVGRLGVTVIDPDGISTALRYRTKEGADAFSALSLETASPVNGVEYARTVPLVEGHLSFIEYRLEFTVGGKNGITTALSAGFDAGEIPDVTVKAHVRQNGQVFAQVSGDSDTRSIRVLAWRAGEEPGDVAAAVRAATALNGREVLTGDLLDQPLAVGERATVYAFGYSQSSGAGIESSAIAFDVVEFVEITPAFLEVVKEEEDRTGSPVGVFRVKVNDPNGVATRVRYKTKTAATTGAVTSVSGWVTETTPAVADGAEYERTVPLSVGHASQVIYEIESTIAGQTFTTELPSAAFDLGLVPDIVIDVRIDNDGDATVAWTGDFDTASVKIVAWEDGSAPGDIPAAVRAATAINGRSGVTGPLVTGVTDGTRVFAAAFGYAEAVGAGYEGELEQTSTLFRGRVDPVELIAEIEYTRILGVPNATVTVTIQDPQGLARAVNPMTAFTATGPVPSFDLTDYTVRTPTMSGTYVFEVPLSEKHVSVCALAYYWVDPADSTENLTQRILWLDVNDDANIIDVVVTYTATSGLVQVKGDSDTVSLHAEEYRGGDWTSVLDPTPTFNGPQGDRFATTRRGSFSIDLDNTEREIRVFGRNAAGERGPSEEIRIQGLLPTGGGEDFRITQLVRADPAGTPPFDPEEFSIRVFFFAAANVDMVETQFEINTVLYDFQHIRSSWNAVPSSTNQFWVNLVDSIGVVVNWSQTDTTVYQLDMFAYESASIVAEDFRVFRPDEFGLGVFFNDGTASATSASFLLGSGLVLDVTGAPTIVADPEVTDVTAGYGIDISETTPTVFEVAVEDQIADVTVDTAAPSGNPTRVGSIWFVIP